MSFNSNFYFAKFYSLVFYRDQHDKKQNQKRYRQQNNRLKVLSKKRELEPSDLSTKNNFREKRLIRLREENRRLVGEVMKTKLELKKKEKLIEQLKIKTKTRTNNAEQGKLINKLKSQLQDATAEKLVSFFNGLIHFKN